MNILFTSAGRRLYLINYFKTELVKFNPDSKIFAADMQLTAPALIAADEAIQVSSIYSENYIDEIIDICRRHDIGILIPLNDLELPLLAKKKQAFEEIGVHVIVSSPEIIDICFDKYKTAQFINSLGLKTPLTYIDYQEALKELRLGKLHFPLVLKPRWGSGSIGIEFVDDYEELEIVYNLLKKKIKKSILSTASVSDKFILIQEKIEGPEYGLDIINNLDGENRGVSIKRKLAMRAGETDKAITIENDTIREIGERIAESLKHTANLDCDILERNGEFYVLELNPRFGGGYPFSHEAGVNIPKAIIAWANNEDIDAKYFTPKIGETNSKCDILVNIKE